MSNLREKDKIFVNTFLFLFLAELLSFLGYYYPAINFLTFFAIAVLTIVLALYRLEYGLYILLAELFIGSFGYLFYFELGQTKISLRQALWLIIMSVWLAKTLLEWAKAKRLSVNFFKSSHQAYSVVLAIFVVWGLANGFLRGNATNNIFLDFNGWLYFLLIFPVFSIIGDKEILETTKQIFLASATWLSVKTLLLAYFFSHDFGGFILDLYRWIRLSGVGEITLVQGGFYRVFMQSQIYILIGFFILIFYLLMVVNVNKRLLTSYFLLLTLFLSGIIISFSRSFWLGLAAGALFIWLVALFKLKIKFKQFLTINSAILLVIAASLILTLMAIKFPYPRATASFDATELLGQRATQLTNEAGASSRWQLLPALWQKIKTAPLMGQGFGATVTYKTSDPRILASNPSGLYTTYAFEWGWLDVWLKLGLFGLLAYLILFIKIIKDGLRVGSFLSLSLITGLVVLAVVNIFSPYVNHPLGIGYLILIACLTDSFKIKGPAQSN